MKIVITLLFALVVKVATAQTSTADVWINEVHYDHVTTRGEGDSLEFIELVMKNSIVTNATELAKYTVVLYTTGALDNAALTLGRGLPYNTSSKWYTAGETTHPLTGFQQCPVAVSNFTILSKKMPVLQDVPAAMAIVYNNTTIVQLLSYEKAFKIESAVRGGGPAAGMTTQLMTKPGGAPAMENALSPTTHSVSLIGAGAAYADFQWDDGATVTSTPCARNTNGTTTQSFTSTALAVNYISLTARGAKDMIYVSWKVSAEEDVDRYIIEVANISEAFAAAGQMAARLSNNGVYQSSVAQLGPGTYKVRIRSVLRTGGAEYSETRIVKLGGKDTQVLSVYPNPAKGFANLQLVPNANSTYTIELVNQEGKVLYKKLTSLLQANMLNQVNISLQNIPQGVYQLRVTNATNKQSIKLVVVR